MSIISEIVEKKEEAPPFPRLMLSILDNELPYVVLFTSARKGMIVNIGNDRIYTTLKVGAYSETWLSCEDRKVWIPFNGEITLKNA